MGPRATEFLLTFVLPFLAGGLSICLLMRWVVKRFRETTITVG